MTEPRHFHSARKGSGSLRPFPIYPLYTQTVILSLDKPIADCFLFRPRKSRKSAGNAVIPTFPTHWSHGLQHLRRKRRNVRFEGLRRVHTCLRQQDRTQRLTRRNTGLPSLGHSTVLCCQRNRHHKNSRRKRMHAYGVCPLPPASRPRWAAWSFLFLTKLRFSPPVLRAFRMCETWEVSLPSVRFACSRNAGRPLVKTAHLPFSEVRWA